MARSRKWLRGAFAASLLLGAATAGGGCYGPFHLTKSVHEWNGEVSEEKWVQEGIFLAFLILPVYGITTLVDALVLNSIEFWRAE